MEISPGCRFVQAISGFEMKESSGAAGAKQQEIDELLPADEDES